MIGVLKKIWDFAGEEQDNIRKSMILGFFYAVFHMFQIAAIYVVVLALVGGSTDSAPAWQALGLLLASILGRAVLNRFSQLQQTHAGYFMVANKRISIGDKLKRVPMGYFNDQSLGELTGITTTVLDEVESTGPMVLVGILGGLINSAVMLLCVLFWDWRIGLLALAGMLVYALYTVAVFSVFWTALSLICPNLYIYIFMKLTTEILEMAPAIIRCYGLSFILLPLNIFSTYYFQALMKPKAAFIVSVARGFIISGILIMVLPAVAGADSIWLAMPVTELAVAVYAAHTIVKYTKKLSFEKGQRL